MRKSKIFLILSVLCLAVFSYICFIAKLPSNLPWNTVRIILIVLTIIFCIISIWLNNLEYNTEYVKKGDEKIAELREKSNNIALVVAAYSKYIYENLPSDLKEEYSIIINKDDEYLLDMNENCNLMHSEIMKDKRQASKKLMVLPLILGISSFCTFAVYYYSANHALYSYIDIICVGPILSFIGVIISIVTRKSRKLYPTLWTSGLVICLFGFIICVLTIILLIMIMAAAFNGTWL